MARLIRTRNATDPTTGMTIQHALWDTNHSYEIHRWDEEAGTNEVIDETTYEGVADRKAARYTALGELSHLHLQAMHDIHGETYVNEHGVPMRWNDRIERYVIIRDENE